MQYAAMLAEKRTAFKGKFGQFLEEIKAICTVCYFLDRLSYRHTFEAGKCARGYCVRCWTKGAAHPAKDCPTPRLTFPNGICFYCALPQRLYGEQTHSADGSNFCGYRDSITPIVWLCYEDMTLQSRWTWEFGIDPTNISRFREWLGKISSEPEFGEEAKITNMICLAMWFYNEHKQMKSNDI